MQGASEFLAKVIVNNRSIQEKMPYAMAAIISAIAIPGLLILFAAPRLNIDGGVPGLARPRRALVAACCWPLRCCALCMARGRSMRAPQAAADPPLQITVDLDHAITNTGDSIEFNTRVTNNGAENSADLNVSMNIIKIGTGDPVDPEDWSRNARRMSVRAGAGRIRDRQSWVVDTIMAGNYMVYITIDPSPG